MPAGYRRRVRTVSGLALGFAAALLLAASIAPSAGATASYTDTLTGTEIPPISSTLGTFVGVATGALPAAWRVQIAHRPLASGDTVDITGGSFSLVARNGARLGGPVSGGSVTVTDRGSRCRSQTYHVVASFSAGAFDGTLTHHRRSLFGRCVIYAATIKGRGTFSV
jgi:hypothetical protein